MKRCATLLLFFACACSAQTITANIVGQGGGKPALAVVNFRGADSQQFMPAFNTTLSGDLENSGLFNLIPKSVFPLHNPQQPSDLRPEDGHQGFSLPDWAGSPVGATHLVFGYAAAQNGVLVLYGYVYDTRQPNAQSAQLFSQRYVGSLDQAGAIKVAHEFANDIIQKFGGIGTLIGSRIYFSSNRTGHDEIWVMDWDGSNQKQLTHTGVQSLFPQVSSDGSRVAFTTLGKTGERLVMADTTTGRTVPFASPAASVNANATWTPDGKTVYFASTSGGGPEQIFSASAEGKGLHRVLFSKAVAAEPKVNPRNPSVLLFVSGLSGPEQIYRMTSDGAGVARVTDGRGEAANPAWSPDGEHIAFASTGGYARGAWNIFVMDIGSHEPAQLTHNEGKNENPVWAPDGRHLVFMSNRNRGEQIYTMVADGTQVKQLTTQGSNRCPVWGVR